MSAKSIKEQSRDEFMAPVPATGITLQTITAGCLQRIAISLETLASPSQQLEKEQLEKEIQYLQRHVRIRSLLIGKQSRTIKNLRKKIKELTQKGENNG